MKVHQAELATSAFGPEGMIQDGRAQVAFAGRSNVGKSSLLNRLLSRKALARTSRTPGRTRSINYFLINGQFYFVDLPGYGYAKAGRSDRQAWARLVGDYLDASRDRTHVVLLVDAKIRSPLDQQAVQYFSDLGLGLLIAATKIDRIPRSRRSPCLAEIAEHLQLDSPQRNPMSDRESEQTLAAPVPIVAVSAKTGEGIHELWAELNLRRRNQH